MFKISQSPKKKRKEKKRQISHQFLKRQNVLIKLITDQLVFLQICPKFMSDVYMIKY